MSTEVRRAMPAAVSTQNGYDAVNYSMLGLKMVKLPAYDVGTNYITHDHPAIVHKGEEIKPAQYVDVDRAARNETVSLLTRLLASNNTLIKRVEQLTSNQKIDNNALLNSSREIDELLDNISAGGGPLLVKVVTA